MGTADRLYELTCECRDMEQSMGRVLRESAHQQELAAVFKRAARKLLERLDEAQLAGVDLPAGVAERAYDLKQLIS